MTSMKPSAIHPLDRAELVDALSEIGRRCEVFAVASAVADSNLGTWRPLDNAHRAWLESRGGRDRLDRVMAAVRASEPAEPGVVQTDGDGPAAIVPILIRRRCVGHLIVVAPDKTGKASQPVAFDALARTVGWWLEDLGGIHEAGANIQSFGRQLTDAYEEIALLHKIGRNMNVIRTPAHFIDLVCTELREVMPFRWIAVRLLDRRGGPVEFARSMHVRGDLPCDAARAAEIFDRFIDQLPGPEPVALEGAALIAHPDLAALGAPTLVQPLTDGEEIYGAIVVGGKHGDRPQINTFDMKLLDATASNLRIFLDNVALYTGLERMFLGTLDALTASIDAKDPYTCGHSRRVAYLSRSLAEKTGLPPEIVDRVHIAGLVHDVGKIGVPEAVLCKPGKLTDAEFALIKRHPEIGARILRDIPNFDDVIPGVMSHHERFDGRGYPQGLKGTDIPLFGRIIGIADSFDAMSSNRTYRSALKRDEVLQEIRDCAGRQFDPALVPAFLSLDFAVYDALVREHQAQEAAQRQKGVAA